MIKVYTLRVLDRVTAEHPNVRLSMYVDDVSIGATGAANDVVEYIADAFADTAASLKDALFLDLAPAKGRIVASTAALASRIARVVGDTGGTAVDSAPHLGIDAAAGKRRAKWASNADRRARLRKAIGRVHRLLRLRRAGGERAKTLVATGLRPQAAYGADIHGVDNKDQRLASDIIVSDPI